MDEKSCQFCGETVKTSAIVCKFCKYDLTAKYEPCRFCLELIKSAAEVCRFCSNDLTEGGNLKISEVPNLKALPIPLRPKAEPTLKLPKETVTDVNSKFQAKEPFNPRAGMFSSGVRAQVLEVIVRQAIAGAPWRTICAGPMQVNNISVEEIEAEIRRRRGN